MFVEKSSQRHLTSILDGKRHHSRKLEKIIFKLFVGNKERSNNWRGPWKRNFKRRNIHDLFSQDSRALVIDDRENVNRLWFKRPRRGEKLSLKATTSPSEDAKAEQPIDQKELRSPEWMQTAANQLDKKWTTGDTPRGGSTPSKIS